LPVGCQRLPEDGFGAGVELGLLGRLLGKRLDDVDADDVLLGDCRDVRQLLLHLPQCRMGDAAVPVGEHDEERRDGEREQGQPPLDEEEHGGHGHHREHVLEEENQPVAEEKADSLEVDRRPRHQLPGLMAVVEAEREADQVRVQPVPQVHLDAERLLARDQPAADHQRRLRDPEPDDRPDEDPQRVGVARPDRLVDHALRHPDQRDLRRLRANGQHDRDDERHAVGAKEADQAKKRPPVAHPLHPFESSQRVSGYRCARTRAIAWSRRARFAGAFSHRLTPEGCGSGTTAAPPRA
jgi:hypothetical protein